MDMVIVLDWCDNVEVDVDVIPELLVFANGNTFEFTFGYDEAMPAIWRYIGVFFGW